MTETILSLENVYLRLMGNAGPVNIINGISLDVSAGETLAITGPSGSGKSSLLMLMAGLEDSTGGEIRVFGNRLSELRDNALNHLRRGRIGIVFQSFHLIPTMTALENVATPLELAGDRNAFSRARSELLSVGLEDRVDHYPAQMSGGEQQRVAIARATVTSPELILADEPTGNLDQTTGQSIMDLLFDLREQTGSTLILVTHSSHLARRCQRIVGLIDGTIDTATT